MKISYSEMRERERERERQRERDSHYTQREKQRERERCSEREILYMFWNSVGGFNVTVSLLSNFLIFRVNVGLGYPG